MQYEDCGDDEWDEPASSANQAECAHCEEGDAPPAYGLTSCSARHRVSLRVLLSVLLKVRFNRCAHEEHLPSGVNMRLKASTIITLETRNVHIWRAARSRALEGLTA